MKEQRIKRVIIVACFLVVAIVGAVVLTSTSDIETETTAIGVTFDTATTYGTTAVVTARETTTAATSAADDSLTTFVVDAVATTASSTTTTAATTTTTTTTTTTAATTTTQVATTTTSTSAEEAEEVIASASLFSSGFLSYMFDTEGNFYYTNEDPWQRSFGFNELYDIGAAFVCMYYDTMRIYFEYDDKDWLIQFWKGQYGYVFIGSEIGVYNKPTSRTLEHYDCASDEDSLKMSQTTYRNGEEIFTRGYGTYWWCTGFVPGMLESFADRSELTMEARITMKDSTMKAAFVAGLDENIANGVTVEYYTSGLDVYITYY